MKKSRKMLLLLLPLLIAYVFQATQYARAPIKYGYYVVYAKNADISILPGTDLSPSGDPLLQNSTIQEGLYNLTLGKWGPGYRINYTDAFHIRNREAFNISLISLNFSSPSNGTDYLAAYIRNDTDGDGAPDGGWIAVWLGSQTWAPADGNQLDISNYIFFTPNSELPVKLEIKLPESGLPISPGTPELFYTGDIYLWFTSLDF